MFTRKLYILNLVAVFSLFLYVTQTTGKLNSPQTPSSSGESDFAPTGYVGDSDTLVNRLTTDGIDIPESLPSGMYQPIGEVVSPFYDTRGVEEEGGYVYLLTREGDLYTYDVSDLPTRTSFTSYNTPISNQHLSNGNGLLRNGDYLYAFGYNGITILDIQYPASPIVIGSRNDLVIYNLVQQSNYIIAPGYQGVAIYSILDPTTPILLSIYPAANKIFFSAAMYGNIVYTSEFEMFPGPTYTFGFRVINVSNPYNPYLEHYINRDSVAYHLMILGNKLIECGEPDFSDYPNIGYVGLWSLDTPTDPIFQTSQPAYTLANRVCALDGNKIVVNGKVFRANGNTLELVDTFSAGWGQVAGFPHGSTVRSNFVFIVQSPRVLILKKGNTIVGDAHLDINMPYDTNRGCSSPYIGCGGFYHGFYKGVCTDLVLDAYNAGGPFDIQTALYQDYLTNRGRYRWASARNADDMRRYFVYNQYFIPNNQPYQLGDIAFFDWDGNGITDHVNVISEVDSNNRPLKMVDATGRYAGNPGGNAFEHNWSSYYDQHVQGHGRVNGIVAESLVVAKDMLQILQVSVDSPLINIQLLDANGKSVSETYDENLIASNVDAFIPYIPGGTYTNLGSQTIITVTQPLSNTTEYIIELQSQASTMYHLLIETLQDSVVTDSQMFTQTIGINETHNISITISGTGEGLQFTATPPVLAPSPSLPDLMTLTAVVNTSTQGTFTITETGGLQAFSGVTVYATDLYDQQGNVFSSSRIAINPSSFTIPAGESQMVLIDADISGIPPGLYLGRLVITSQTAGTRMIMLILNIQPHTLFLPLINR
jgi:hypothetical protein